ncbi:pentatricopeptide repeat-containing protein At5g61800 [Aristolochia californica]|uniref:pentatricopeptide repeat-containing protein At5g61800 n=1 Tax=Aristolochia californica TaxID=171875 RepID=UPI0035DF8ABE
MKIETILQIFRLPQHRHSIRNFSGDQTLLLLSHCKSLQQLQAIHAQAITNDLISLYPSLILNKILFSITLLSSFPTIHYALDVFNQIPNQSTFSYNNIIRAYTLQASPLSALRMFARMRHCVPPDSHTYPFALKACVRLRAHLLARVLHSQALKFGFVDDIFVRNTLIHVYSDPSSMAEACLLFYENSMRDVVTYNVLIDGFVKAGDTVQARRILDEMPAGDSVSWGTLLAGYARMKQCKEAIQLFDEMIASGIQPDNVALVSVLSACAQLGTVQRGEVIHDYIKSNRIQLDVFLSTALVDMYAKCGFIKVALDVFQSSFHKNLSTWNAIIMGLAMHGHGELSLEYFWKMRRAGIRPDAITFLGALVGCSHAGLVDEAQSLFNIMEDAYGVRRDLRHYGCMADLLSRAGLIDDVVRLIEKMPMQADVYVWGGLLGGCRIHGRVDVAEIAARRLMDLDPEDGGVYSIMVSMYATANRWEDVVRIRRLMSEREVKRNTGYSWIPTGSRH